MTTLTVHPELADLIPPLTTDELAQLTANLRAEGCRDALIVWLEQQVLLDGHNRYAICQRYELPYTVHSISLPDLDAAKAWMLKHQLGRRNLTPEQMSYLRGKERELVGQQHGSNQHMRIAHCALSKTDKQLANDHKVDVATLKRDAAFTKDVDAVAEVIGPKSREDILARDAKVDRKAVHNLAKIAKANPAAAHHVMTQVREAPTPKAARAVVDLAVKDLRPMTPEHDTAVAPIAPLTLAVQDVAPKEGLETIRAADGLDMYILHKPNSTSLFNKTNEMVDWASWTWNPVTGCWHGCTYCYAREIANNPQMAQAYPKQFEPVFHPSRLDAPKNTKVPKELTRPADKNVFVCSMADLFGKWVPDDWILQVFERVQVHPEWNFLFLTKFPQRLQAICDMLDGFPSNAWVGCTVDSQARVATAERAFQHIRASVKWLSVEPLLERLTFHTLDMFDWLVLGAQTASYFNKTPAIQPEPDWVWHLIAQAYAAKVKIYWKENLLRPKQVPWQGSPMLSEGV